jgi:hypothetical protein
MSSNLSTRTKKIPANPKSEIQNSQCIVGPVGLRHGVANAEAPVRIRYDAPNPVFSLYRTFLVILSDQLGEALERLSVAAAGNFKQVIMSGMRDPV